MGRPHPRVLACLLLLLAPPLRAQGVVRGTVATDDGRPAAGARVVVRAPGGDLAATSAMDGRFAVGAVPAGIHAVTARLLGYRPAELPAVRVADGDTVDLRITLTRAPTQLSTVVVVRSPVDVDAATSASPRRIPLETATLLPTARDASSLVALVPGAKDGRLWGGAGAATNDFRLDGVTVGHPGTGGDALALPREWVDAITVHGLGADAEWGNFQGGVVDAATRTGTDRAFVNARAFVEPAAWAGSGLVGREIGAEQAARTEFGAEAGGALRPGRLYHFVGVRAVDRTLRAFDLRTADPDDHVRDQQAQRDVRAMAKLSWRPRAGDALDLMLGRTDQQDARAGLNGLDAVAALPDATQATTWYGGRWDRALSPAAQLTIRLGGFTQRLGRTPTAGRDVPAVRVIARGELPLDQNAEFRERTAAESHTLSAMLRLTGRAFGAAHEFTVGGEGTLGAWDEQRIRSGGLTWRPYVTAGVPLDPTDASTWTVVGSDWGGERHVGSRTASAAGFVQDRIALGTRVTVSPGVRVTNWTGWLSYCSARQGDSRCGQRFRAVTTTALDPRLGVAWDVTGRGRTAVKLHAGRFHQGMQAQLFDRVAGVNANTDRVFHYYAPPLTSSRQTFTPARRDALLGPTGFSPFADVEILSEAGRVDGYRQPYVDQLTAAFEQAIGAHWKGEVRMVARRNGDIVGLLDRNLGSNYTRLTDVRVDHRLVNGAVLDANGDPLVLEELWVSNADLIAALNALNRDLRPGMPPRGFAGYFLDDVAGLAFAPDRALTTLPDARRLYRQLTATLTVAYPRWQGEASVTVATLEGNVAGMTGHGVVDGRFTAGPFTRPNEAVHARGALPDATEFEAKAWVTARLPWGFAGGALYTHILGERVTPSFTILGRYAYTDASGQRAPAELLRQVIGQQVFVEPRGSRHYASRGVLDLHLERAFASGGATAPARRVVVAADLLNALGSRALVRVKTSIDDQSVDDPASRLGAPRQRVSPRALRIGLRLE